MLNLDTQMAQSAFAALIGVTRQAVSAMVREGILVRGQTGREWLADYLGHLREVAAGRADTPAAQHSRERILAAEAQRREELAAMATAKRREQDGALIRIDDADVVYVSACRTARNSIWGWQGGLPPLLEHRPAVEIGTILAEEARRILTEMEGTFPRRVHTLMRWVGANAPENIWTDGGPTEEQEQEGETA